MFLLFLITQSPDWKEFSLNTLSLFSFLPIVLVVVVFSIFFILSDHSFHNFHTSFESSRESSSFMRSFWFLFFAILVIISILFLELLNVRVPNLPLCDLSSEVISYGRACGSSSLSDRGIDSLNLSVFVVEFVLHSLLDGFCVFAWTWFFLFGLSFNLLKFALSVVLYFLLDLVLVGSCVNIVSFKTKMHD